MHDWKLCKNCWQHAEYLRYSRSAIKGRRKEDLSEEEKLDLENLERDIKYIRDGGRK